MCNVVVDVGGVVGFVVVVVVVVGVVVVVVVTRYLNVPRYRGLNSCKSDSANQTDFNCVEGVRAIPSNTLRRNMHCLNDNLRLTLIPCAQDSLTILGTPHAVSPLVSTSPATREAGSGSASTQRQHGCK